MQIVAIKTPRVVADDKTIFEVIDAVIPKLAEGSILAVTSKIVSICEGDILPVDSISKDELVIREAELYLPSELSRYGHHFTITRNTLIAMSGVDESNGEGYYIVWPNDVQQTANDIRRYLRSKYQIDNLGVVITDSTCQPLRRGTTGIALAHSGFRALRNYVGQPDIFGRALAVTQANVSGGIAAAAVLAMGEGNEQTPLCLLTDIANIDFQDADPDQQELQEIRISLEEDLFAPFLSAVDWKRGGK